MVRVMSDVLSATLQLAPGARPGVTTAQVAAAAAAAWRGEGEDTGTLPAAAHTNTGKEKRNSRQLAVALWRDAWPRFVWSIFSVCVDI